MCSGWLPELEAVLMLPGWPLTVSSTFPGGGHAVLVFAIAVYRLDVGTESAVDDSKSIKSHLMMLFEEAGNTDIEVPPAQHCTRHAGHTIAGSSSSNNIGELVRVSGLWVCTAVRQGVHSLGCPDAFLMLVRQGVQA